MKRIKMILVMAIVLLSAFLAVSCEVSTNQVGSKRKIKFEINPYIFHNNTMMLSKMKERYNDVAFSGITGTYSSKELDDIELLRSYISFEVLGRNLQYKTIDEVTLGDETFKVGDDVKIAIGEGLYYKGCDDQNDLYFPEIVTMIEFLNNPVLTINGDKYNLPDFPEAKDTTITEVTSPKQGDVIKRNGNKFNITLNSSPDYLTFSFKDSGVYCVTKRIYRLKGETKGITYGYILPDEIGNLYFYLDEYTPEKDYDEIEYWVFMAGDENAPVYKAKATLSFMEK